jgi:hypothetical protein
MVACAGLCLYVIAGAPSRATALSAAQSRLHQDSGPGGSGSISGGGVYSVVGAGGSGSTPTGSSAGGNGYSPDGSGSTFSPDNWVAAGPDAGYECSNGSAVPLQPIVGQGNPPVTPTIYHLVDPSGQVLQTTAVCPSPGSTATAPPPPPPAAPTPAEAAAATPFPAPVFGLNPAQLGLTGLASWFWAGNVPGMLTSTSSVRGYTVVTTAHPVKFYWYFGDGASASSGSAGTEAAPSVTHVYQAKGLYTVTLTIAWQGQYTFSGNGVRTQTVQLGTVDQTPARTSYPVQEIRSVLVTPTTA